MEPYGSAKTSSTECLTGHVNVSNVFQPCTRTKILSARNKERNQIALQPIVANGLKPRKQRGSVSLQMAANDFIDQIRIASAV